MNINNENQYYIQQSIYRFLNDGFIKACNNNILELTSIAPVKIIISSNGMEAVIYEEFQERIDKINFILEEYKKANYPELFKSE